MWRYKRSNFRWNVWQQKSCFCWIGKSKFYFMPKQKIRSLKSWGTQIDSVINSCIWYYKYLETSTPSPLERDIIYGRTLVLLKYNPVYLSLRIVEVCRNSNDSFWDRVSEECISCFLHLGQNHGRNFLGEKGLYFSLILGLDLRFAAIADDLKKINAYFSLSCFWHTDKPACKEHPWDPKILAIMLLK